MAAQEAIQQKKGETGSLRPFWILWSGQAVSLFGSQLVQFALIWWLTQETGSATILAMASLVGLLPQVLLGPFVGVLVDRLNRRLILLVSDTVIAVASIGLALLFWTDQVAVWHLFAVLFIRAIGGAFHWSTMQSSISLMVPRSHLTRIQGINQILQGGLNIAAAPLAAFLIGFLSMQAILGIDVVTALFAIAPLFFIAIPQPETAASTTTTTLVKSSFWADLRSGLQYVRTWPGVLFMMGLAALINFMLTPAASLQPILITEHFQGEAIHLAVMEAALSVGIILGGLLLGAWGGFSRRIYTTLMGLLGMGISFFLVGVAPANWFWLAVVGAFLVGGTMALTNGPALAILQAAVEPGMQGRVFNLLNSISMGMAPLSLIIAGPVSDLIGVRAWFMAGGVITFALGVTGFFNKALLTIEDGRSPAPAESGEVTAETAVVPHVPQVELGEGL